MRDGCFIYFTSRFLKKPREITNWSFTCFEIFQKKPF